MGSVAEKIPLMTTSPSPAKPGGSAGSSRGTLVMANTGLLLLEEECGSSQISGEEQLESRRVFFFFFFMVLGCELRTSHLLCRCYTT
jgi:hypothetical protein